MVTIVSCSQDPVEPIIPEVPSVVLRASFAGDADTRTSFGDFTSSGSFAQIQWNEGDAINVFYGTNSSTEPASARFETAVSGQTAEFSPSEEETAEDLASASKLYGLYPFLDEASASFASSTIKTTIPSSQEAISNTFDPQSFPAVGVTNTIKTDLQIPEMAFYNVCGGFCFTLKNPSRYSSIELLGNAGEAICGDIEISMSNPANPIAKSVGTTQTKITLTPTEGTAFQTGVRYYISLLPG